MSSDCETNNTRGADKKKRKIRPGKSEEEILSFRAARRARLKDDAKCYELDRQDERKRQQRIDAAGTAAGTPSHHSRVLKNCKPYKGLKNSQKFERKKRIKNAIDVNLPGMNASEKANLILCEILTPQLKKSSSVGEVSIINVTSTPLLSIPTYLKSAINAAFIRYKEKEGKHKKEGKCQLIEYCSLLTRGVACTREKFAADLGNATYVKQRLVKPRLKHVTLLSHHRYSNNLC